MPDPKLSVSAVNKFAQATGEPPMPVDSGLSPEKQEQVRLAIVQALEIQEVYLDPELNLSTLADSLQVSTGITSKVINTCFNKSFRNLINHYRIERVKKMCAAPTQRTCQ